MCCPATSSGVILFGIANIIFGILSCFWQFGVYVVVSSDAVRGGSATWMNSVYPPYLHDLSLSSTGLIAGITYLAIGVFAIRLGRSIRLGCEPCKTPVSPTALMVLCFLGLLASGVLFGISFYLAYNTTFWYNMFLFNESSTYVTVHALMATPLHSLHAGTALIEMVLCCRGLAYPRDLGTIRYNAMTYQAQGFVNTGQPTMFVPSANGQHIINYPGHQVQNEKFAPVYGGGQVTTTVKTF